MVRGEGRKPQKRGAFGTAHKLPSGRWRAMYHGPDGRRYTAPKTFLTEKDARGWLSLRQAEIIRKAWVPPEADEQAVPKLTFETYAKTWMAQRDLKDRTREHYEKLLEDHIVPTFGALPIASITADDVRAWHAKFGTKTPTLRAHGYGLLRTIMGTALSDGKIKVNPCVIRGAGSARRVHKIRPATLDEIATIAEEMPERYRAMVLLAAWCALRFGELTELRRRDIIIDADDPDDTYGVVRVERAVVRVEQGFQITTPKSDAGCRDVEIPPHLLPAIRDHLDRFVEPDKDALLFPAAHGGHLAPASLYRQFYRARSVAKRDDLRWHDLRHSGAVLAAATGATLAELMARLGHSTPQAAMRYQHAAQGRDRQIARLLSKMVATDPER
ncbi:tyrosine-type recombinase/integrase [Mycobacterium avium subsp. hominissuis]|uniref:tyrosine-type recombinase/integrase n=1 Tax=Mycobacterium avium TaxID=1764 RepID=UPI001CC5567D|nr:site-specific integrase [Mycobacterium avium]MBZ4558592.1 tyrosine-type recombinase/integrase [Mycobacterium avium subsp. hominissuis]MBZ4569627.1 tyrosine-type recombinase/integrase [Mycobacterium avium subsp. hominissuis]MBZ4587935.1 tyrosine-type recombinase/integrase [Mycobacterium avium subsp. hominissuis]MBZ4625442.1 tyrosine-type recombinase/integrase [Mycobacterium avium subsp. hominissuis]